jgi:hypothetical protein
VAAGNEGNSQGRVAHDEGLARAAGEVEQRDQVPLGVRRQPVSVVGGQEVMRQSRWKKTASTYRLYWVDGLG